MKSNRHREYSIINVIYQLRFILMLEDLPENRPCKCFSHLVIFAQPNEIHLKKDPHIVDNLLIIPIFGSLRHFNIDHFFELEKKKTKQTLTSIPENPI